MQWQLLALISAVFSAGAAIFEKKSLLKEEALDFSATLAIFNIVLSTPFIFSIDFANLSYPALAVLYGKSILGMTAFLFIMKGLKSIELSGALPILVLTPGLVAIFAFLLLGESLTGLQVAGMLLLLAGTYVLQMGHRKNLLEPFLSMGKSRAHRFLLGALFIFTLTSLLDKWLLKGFKLQPYTMLYFQHIFLGFNFLVLTLITHKSLAPLRVTLIRSWKPILLVSIFTIVYRYTQILSIKAGSVALTLALKRISVFIAVVIGGQYFREHFLLRKAIATAILIAGATMIILL